MINDFINKLYVELLVRRKALSLETYKRYLSMRYKINMETEAIKNRIYG